MKRWHWIAGLMLALTPTAATAASPDPYAEAAAQIATYAADHRVLILGELHGTRETPLLARAVVERYAIQAPVRVALELPTSENAALSAYLSSNGDAAARQALRKSRYWQVKDHLHDGRRSHDVLDLVEAVRLLRADGRDVHVSGFDRIPDPADAAPGTRDAGMADELRAQYAALPEPGRLLVLTGNVHAMRVPPKMIPYPTAAALLKDLPYYSVRIEAREGEFWGCRGYRRCGSLPVRKHSGVSPRPDVGADRDYDLWLYLPRFTVARLLP